MAKITSMIAAVALVVAMATANIIYPLTGIVTEVDYSSDTVTIECVNGNQFQFTGCEDYFEGDLVGCIMYWGDNESENVYDDEILICRYVGHVTQFMEIYERMG